MNFLSLLPIVGKVLDRVIPDPEAKREAQFKLMEMAQRGELAELDAETKLLTGQLEINKEEAKNANLFVAGWRPAFGWTCCIILFWTYILAPLFNWVAALNKYAVSAPMLDLQGLWPLILGILGIGGLRSFDKSQGTATSVGGVILTPVKKAEPTQGAVAPQDAQATPPAPTVPVQPDTAIAVEEKEEAPKKSRWIKG